MEVEAEWLDLKNSFCIESTKVWNGEQNVFWWLVSTLAVS